jgi:hypothetical protein
MKTAIVGSRTFQDYIFFKESIISLNINIDEIISGGAIGTDSLAERFAEEFDIPITVFKPNWELSSYNKFSKM